MNQAKKPQNNKIPSIYVLLKTPRKLLYRAAHASTSSTVYHWHQYIKMFLLRLVIAIFYICWLWDVPYNCCLVPLEVDQFVHCIFQHKCDKHMVWTFAHFSLQETHRAICRDGWWPMKSQIWNICIYTLEQPNPEELLSRMGRGTGDSEKQVWTCTCLPLNLR